ncbi:hypothetical protein DFH07DRAFT_110254 [Mycena maculata]|uniref:Uncharacterized protein n=1 Tax=Mycena maculata TaxID=230809 RepID=A0AAD7I626_9AGAR|nr:hypothetical protein DFH07DRAFT_110254 [Mycena maculata]
MLSFFRRRNLQHRADCMYAFSAPRNHHTCARYAPHFSDAYRLHPTSWGPRSTTPRCNEKTIIPPHPLTLCLSVPILHILKPCVHASRNMDVILAYAMTPRPTSTFVPLAQSVPPSSSDSHPVFGDFWASYTLAQLTFSIRMWNQIIAEKTHSVCFHGRRWEGQLRGTIFNQAQTGAMSMFSAGFGSSNRRSNRG